MSRFSIHTNIALDYPAYKSGYIYTSENIIELFTRPSFREKIRNRTICGSYNIVKLKISKEEVSHIVIDAFVTGDKEVMFSIETLQNDLGVELELDLIAGKSVLGKVVTRLSNMIIDGKVKVCDIRYVHIVGLDVDNESSDIETD